MGERKASGGVIAAQYYVLRKVTTATFLWEACQQIWTKLGVAGALAVAHAAACLFACAHARSGILAGSSKENGQQREWVDSSVQSRLTSDEQQNLLKSRY